MRTYNTRPDFITLRVIHIGPKYPVGAFEASMKRKGMSNKVKQASLNVYSPEDAYGVVDLWAEDQAKATGIEYEKVSMNCLNEMIATGTNRKTPDSNLKRASTLKEKPSLGHIGYFKADIKKAFEVETADKIREVIKEGLILLKELEDNRIRVAKNSGKAKDDMAKAMYQTFVDTGVDTSIYCNDEDIVNAFKLLKKDYKY